MEFVPKTQELSGAELVRRQQQTKMQGFAGEDADTTGYFKNHEAKFIREVTHKVEGDLDGDGRYSIQELFDKDGDGKISMAEFAAHTGSPTGPEQFAANSVGATDAVKKGWAVLRDARSQGDFVQTIAERVRAGREGMRFQPTKGGWQAPQKAATGSPSAWVGPSTIDHNRNIKLSVQDVANQALKVSREGKGVGQLGAPGARSYK